MKDTATERRRHPRGRPRLLADALYAMLRFLARRVRGFYGAIAAFLAIAFGIGLGAGLVFAAFGHLVMVGATQAFDENVLRLVASIRNPSLDELMVEVTAFGDAMIVGAVVAIAALFLWLTRHRYSAGLLLVAAFGGLLLTSLLKDFYQRPRPLVVRWGTDVGSASFPSGHAMTAFIGYGSIGYLVGRLGPTPPIRRAIRAIAGLIIALVGISRIYLGVHYPADVLAGFLAGLAWTATVGAGVAAIRFFASRRPEVERAERGLRRDGGRERGPDR